MQFEFVFSCFGGQVCLIAQIYRTYLTVKGASYARVRPFWVSGSGKFCVVQQSSIKLQRFALSTIAHESGVRGFSFRGFKDRSGERWEMPLQEDVLDNPCERTEALSPTTNVAYCYAHRPVQAKRAKLCPPLMPHAIATRMSHIWHHTDRYNIS